MKYDSVHAAPASANLDLGRQLAARQTISLLSSLGALGVASAWFRSTTAREIRPSRTALPGGAVSPVVANNFPA